MVHEGVIYHLGKLFLSQASKLKQEILQRAHKELLFSYMQSTRIYSLILKIFDWEGMEEELHQLMIGRNYISTCKSEICRF